MHCKGSLSEMASFAHHVLKPKELLTVNFQM